MSTQILGTVGSAIGTVVGGPVGGFIGGQIGASLGRGSKKHYEGARLETLAVQTSTYGKLIPQLWGSVRLAGNVVWSLPIKEMATTTTVSGGGKGGGRSRSKSTQTQYSYSVTLAIAICQGAISRIERVWADAKLLDLSLGTYRLYTGTETQLPDPLMEAHHGIGMTPAYRGLAYVVIEDFPLGDFGNRIPNFTFEVTRRTPQQDAGDLPAEQLVRSVMLIPGSGEFVYDTNANFKISGEDAYGNWVQTGFETPLNQHTADGKANVLVALDQMQETLPNLEWVGVAVNWFGTSMDIATCEIWPCVEYKGSTRTAPEAWNVAGYTRANARLIGNDDGKIRYGGTPDDQGIVRLCTELRARGLKVFLYPMMLMDVAGKPWRGFLTGNAANVANFFTRTRGYRNFILHYATLLAGKIDAFAIGSELRDLTKITSSTGVYPVVNQFVTLANDVRAILGSSVKLTYAADWSEYHHTDGGWHHLDPLWASSSIDMVGIDAYFPLSDEVQTEYDVDALREGWTSGEGYDWYYSDAERTVKAPIAPAYAWKNIDYWWRTSHTNPNGSATAWVPESKPIWFTEYGFSSVDGCANEPNVFVDASTGTSAYPRFSRGRVDFMAQRTAIVATEMEWAENPMIPRRFLWSWDARPYPYWPDLLSVWSDGASWVTGHWVQGKLGTSHVSAVVQAIAAAAGCDISKLDTSKLHMMLDGFIISERTSARAVLEQLMRAYFFTLRESNGKLVALPRSQEVVATVDVGECISLAQDGREIAYQLERREDLQLPDTLEVHALNRLQRYETHVQSAWRGTAHANEVEALPMALVLSQTHARAVAETVLADRWAERTSVNFQLPMRYAALEPGDVIELVDGALRHRLRLQQVQIGWPGMVRIQAVMDAAQAWDGYIAPTVGGVGEALLPPPATAIEIMDLPAFPGDNAQALTLRIAATGRGPGWGGASVLRTDLSEEVLLTDLPLAATMGSCLTALPVGPSVVVDRESALEVVLLGEGTLSSVTQQAMLNGANAALVGNEVIQFASAELIAPGRYRLTHLLRGRMGTEYAIGMHVAGERFVLLNEAVQAVTLPLSALGQSWQLRAVTAGVSLDSGTETGIIIQGNSLKPLSPVHVKAVRDSSNDVQLRWVRRSRIDNGLRDLVDIPLMEEAELYDVRVYHGNTLLRSWQVSQPLLSYSAAEQMADFGSYPTNLRVSIAQRSGLVGPGFAFSDEIPVR